MPAAVLFAGDADDAGVRFFESKVRPVLVQHCYECHGQKEQEGGLRLDSIAAMRQGGESGTAIVAGEPAQSLLLTAIRYTSEDLQMPPDEKKLSGRQIKDIEHWIKINAPYPDTNETLAAGSKFDWNAARQFWAFRPPTDPPIPPVENKSWPKSPLDRFILAELEKHGLQPAVAADRRTLIRRATFDLTGLPPTLEQTEAFLADDSSDAFGVFVNRLLESPQYGVRWGRHWLDVARYADSNGLDENVAYGNAWRYRNYVINSFNDDKPFDQFVVEQLAGDLLPEADDDPKNATKHERLIATGFLSLGPKVLAEVDEAKMEMDIIDEQVDTVGRTFMALTLGCARCHHHKFDPIRTQDYYAMSGIFKSTRTMEHFKKIARWWENSIATSEHIRLAEEQKERIAAKNTQIEKVIRLAIEQLGKSTATSGAVTKAAVAKDAESRFSDETKAQLVRLRTQLTSLKQSEPELPTAIGVTDGKIVDVAIHVRGSHLTLGAVTPRGFPVALNEGQSPGPPPNQSGRLQLARWLVRSDHPLTSRVIVNRIWRWHFGEGIVASTDNFGKLGERPTNGPLLDWLSRRFVENGWSIKDSHRMIMASATYQMSSAHDEKAAAIDPENRLQWRANVRRLEAEAIRDSLLFVAGTLDQSMGQSMLNVKNREFIFDHTSKDNTNYDSLRRSVYLPVIRNNLYDVFSLFDYSEASMINGSRTSSTIAPQALFMMNSPLVHESAKQLAADLLNHDELDDVQRIGLLHERAFGRQATNKEVDRATRFLTLLSAKSNDANPRSAAWQMLCHAIVASNEFIYVR